MLRNEKKIATFSESVRKAALEGTHDNGYLLEKLSQLHAHVRQSYRNSDERTYLVNKYVHPVSSLIKAI